jgi:hypothetical protein
MACILLLVEFSRFIDEEYILYIPVTHTMITSITTIASAIEVAVFDTFIFFCI